jgi:hypothetical protein
MTMKVCAHSAVSSGRKEHARDAGRNERVEDAEIEIHFHRV